MTSMLPIVSMLAATLGAAGASLAHQSEESVLVTYDLRAVLPRWDAGPSWSQTLLEPPVGSPHRYNWDETLDQSLQYADLAAYELLDLLTQVLGDELRREGRELLVEGQVMTVLAPAGLHEQVRAVLDALAESLGGTIPVRVDVLALAEGPGELPAAGTLGEDEAGKLVASLVGRGARHESFLLDLCAGRTTRLDAFRRVPFLFDYDVEIAQNMMVFAPVMSETREGTRLALRGRPAPGGVALSVLFMRSEQVEEIRKQPLTLKGLVNHQEGGSIEALDGPDGIQSPDVLARSLAFDTFLPEGKALALTLESRLGSAGLREVVLVRRATRGGPSAYVVRPIPRTNRTLIALDAELFRPGRLHTETEPWRDEQGTLHLRALAKFDGEFSSFLVEWLKARFSIWRRFGPWILIVTDPAWDRDAAAQLDRLVKSLRHETALRDVGIELRAQGREPLHPVRIRVPLLAGSTAGLVLARGETAVTGFDVEVAQGAAVPDPYVGSVFEGLILSLGFEGTSVEASGMAQLLDGPIAALEPGYHLLGPIERPEPRVLRFDERLELADGRSGPLRIGGGSDRAEQPGFALEISVSPPPR
jgi:hypothetical protein